MIGNFFIDEPGLAGFSSSAFISISVRQSLITPSCGVGSLAPDIARKVFLLLSGLSERLRKEYASETCG